MEIKNMVITTAYLNYVQDIYQAISDICLFLGGQEKKMTVYAI